MIYSSPYMRARQTITPLSSRLEIGVHIEPDLRERRLSEEPAADFLKAVEETWGNFAYAHPGGESNSAAQQRGMAVLTMLDKQYQTEHIVISTHGNLLALMLHYFDPTVYLNFWKSITLPDIYKIKINPGGGASIHRLWVEE